MDISHPFRLIVALLAGALLSAAQAEAQGQDARINAVERGLRATVQVAGEPSPPMTLRDRMAYYAVPGVSIVVIENGRVAWTHGYGAGRAGEAVTPATLFQAGSISKAVTALAVMREAQMGRLDLDADVNLALRSWRLPASPLSADRPVSLRLLLSHGAGLNVHAFPGYVAGQPVPSLLQVLNGQPPANTEAVRLVARPGTAWTYSGGGYEVIQQLLIDRNGLDFPAFMASRLFRPLGMTRSSFVQLHAAGAEPVAASGHDREGNEQPGRWRIFPEMAAAGLWSTPADLAQVAIAIQRSVQARPGSRTFLTPAMARLMLTRQIGNWGLGFELQGEGRARRFLHRGDTNGFKAALVAFPETGQGAVIMTNGERGSRLIDEILLSIAAAYRWPDYTPKVRVRAAVDPAAFTRLEGTYRLDSLPQVSLRVSRRDDGLALRIVQPGGESESVLLPSAPNRFFRREIDFELEFAEGAPAPRLTLHQEGQIFPATRVAPE